MIIHSGLTQAATCRPRGCLVCSLLSLIRYAALRGTTALKWSIVITHPRASRAEDSSQFMAATSGVSRVPQSGAYRPFLRIGESWTIAIREGTAPSRASPGCSGCNPCGVACRFRRELRVPKNRAARHVGCRVETKILETHIF